MSILVSGLKIAGGVVGGVIVGSIFGSALGTGHACKEKGVSVGDYYKMDAAIREQAAKDKTVRLASAMAEVKAMVTLMSVFVKSKETIMERAMTLAEGVAKDLGFSNPKEIAEMFRKSLEAGIEK